ncbi:MAG: sulfite exporter TauE/SafE family protein [Promethearchaeota archaeon]
MEQFLLFLIEAIPLTILIGITAATIGYTAWSIVVPLLFVGFGFPIFDALFISICVDVINSLILTIIYSRKGKVDFKEGTKYGLIALIGAFLGVLLAANFLEANTDLLRGGSGYLFFIFGAFFFYRGRNLKLKASKKASEENTGMNGDMSGTQAMSPNKKELSDNLKVLIMVVGTILSGLLSGVIGIGSGTNFTLLFMFVFGAKKGFDTLKSTATGCYIMFIITVSLAAIFGYLSGNVPNLLIYLGVMAASSALGTLIGAKFTLTVAEWKLNILIGAAIIIAAAVGMVQANFIIA